MIWVVLAAITEGLTAHWRYWLLIVVLAYGNAQLTNLRSDVRALTDQLTKDD